MRLPSDSRLLAALSILMLAALLLSVSMNWIMAYLVLGPCLVILVGGVVIRYVRRPYAG